MKKSIIRIMLANIINMVIIAATNFMLPAFTTVETYAATKEYTLYITTFSNIVTLGYVQGVYLKYGGKEIAEFKDGEVGTDYLSFLCVQFPISAVFSVVGLFLKDITLVILGLGLLCTNLVYYYQYLYQAVGDFKSYGVALNASKIILLVLYVLLIVLERFVLKSVHYAFYVFAQALATTIIAVVLTVALNKKIKILENAKISRSTILENIKGGVVLMLGAFVSSLFSTIDRWFVKGISDTEGFAVYSFAVSIEHLVISFMTPITVSMYNFFCRGISNEKTKSIKENVIVYSFILIAAAFPAKWIIGQFIPKYEAANLIIFVLFAAQGISTVIKGIYVNLYKAKGMQNKYLKQIVAMVCLSVACNVVICIVYKSMVAIAISTLITNIIWYIISEIQNPDIRSGIKTFTAIFIMLSAYLFCGYCLNTILGLIVYCAIGVIVGFTLMNKTFIGLIKHSLDFVKNKGANKKEEELADAK